MLCRNMPRRAISDADYITMAPKQRISPKAAETTSEVTQSSRSNDRRERARLAQRRSRERREVELNSLRERVEHLSNLIESMNGIFLEFSDRVLADQEARGNRDKILEVKAFIERYLSYARLAEAPEEEPDDPDSFLLSSTHHAGGESSGSARQQRSSSSEERSATSSVYGTESVAGPGMSIEPSPMRRPARLQLDQVEASLPEILDRSQRGFSPRLNYGFFVGSLQSEMRDVPYDIRTFVTANVNSFSVRLYWWTLWAVHSALMMRSQTQAAMLHSTFRFMSRSMSATALSNSLSERLAYMPDALMEEMRRELERTMDPFQLRTTLPSTNQPRLDPSEIENQWESSRAMYQSIMRELAEDQEDPGDWLDAWEVEEHIRNRYQIQTDLWTPRILPGTPPPNPQGPHIPRSIVPEIIVDEYSGAMSSHYHVQESIASILVQKLCVSSVFMGIGPRYSRQVVDSAVQDLFS